MESAHKEQRPFRIIVDHHPHEWPKAHINGLEIKVLAGVDSSYGVWQDLAGPTDPPVRDDEEVDLTRPGVEKFFTGKKTTTEGR